MAACHSTEKYATWEQCLKTRISFLELLTVNCGPVTKGSGNGVTVSAGNVLIFKKEKRQDCYFQIRTQSFEIFGSALLKPNGTIQGNTRRDFLACVRKHTKVPQECRQKLYLCPLLYGRLGLNRDDRLKSRVCGAARANLALELPFLASAVVSPSCWALCVA